MIDKRLWIMLGLTTLLFSLACVPLQDYDKVKSELTVAQTKIDSLQNQINSLQNQVVTKENDLKSAKDKLSQIFTRIEILNWYFYSPGSANMGDSNSVWYDRMREKINSSNDQSLKDNFKTADSAATPDAFKIFWKYIWQSAADIAK